MRKPTKQTTSNVRYIGLDIGDRFSRFAVVDAAGVNLKEDRVPSTKAGLERVFKPLKGARLLMEVGTHSPWIQRTLLAIGIDARVCEARSAAEANRFGRKTDVRDARMLAELLRTDSHLVTLVQHRTLEEQRTWAVIQARTALVKTRTMLVNQIRGMSKSWGTRLEGCTSGAFNGKTWFQVPEDLRAALAPLYEQILNVSNAINGYDKKIAAAVSKNPDAQLLAGIRGVGDLTALAVAMAIGNASRFRRSRDGGAYFGLVPKKRASGESDPQLGISKRGNATVRRLLVCAAHYILGPFNKVDSDLRTSGLRIMGNGNDSRRKRRAVVAVARKLSVVMVAMLKSGMPYQAMRPKKERIPA